MTSDFFEASPMSILNASIRGGLAPGQLGMVMARAGVGKSALLVHIALGHLIRGVEVLHVSLHDRSAHVRSFYQEILGELLRSGAGTEASAQVELEVERNRVIHSVLSGDFTPARLADLLNTLDEVMEFRPAVVIIDGAVESSEVAAAAQGWRDLARERSIRIWGTVRTHRDRGPSARELADSFATAVVLEPKGQQIELCVLRAQGEPVQDCAPLRLDPVTMLVRGQAAAVLDMVAPSPAPQIVTLVSGGTTGAECAFGEVAERWGLAEVNLSFEGHQLLRTRGCRILSEKELRQGAVSILYVNKHLQRIWDRNGPIARILQTQWHLVSQVRQLFVVGSIQHDDTVTGGTGWSVELAKRWNRTVWVFCQEREGWFQWDGGTWVAGVPVIEATMIGGTGTRFLSDAGRQAIEELFERSFGG
jgi:hypothetical protein